MQSEEEGMLTVHSPGSVRLSVLAVVTIAAWDLVWPPSLTACVEPSICVLHRSIHQLFKKWPTIEDFNLQVQT